MYNIDELLSKNISELEDIAKELGISIDKKSSAQISPSPTMNAVLGLSLSNSVVFRHFTPILTFYAVKCVFLHSVKINLNLSLESLT